MRDHSAARCPSVVRGYSSPATRYTICSYAFAQVSLCILRSHSRLHTGLHFIPIALSLGLIAVRTLMFEYFSYHTLLRLTYFIYPSILLPIERPRECDRRIRPRITVAALTLWHDAIPITKLSRAGYTIHCTFRPIGTKKPVSGLLSATARRKYVS